MKAFRLFLRLPRWVLTGVCFALICYLTLVPKPLPDNDIPFWEHTDKIVHAIMFGSLYFCVVLDVWRGRQRPPVKPALMLLGAVTLVGGLIELAQQGMHMGRGGSLADLAADFIGALLALLLSRSLHPLNQGRL